MPSGAGTIAFRRCAIDPGKWTYPLFTIFGIPVRIHLFMILFIAGNLVAGGARGWDDLGWVAATQAILIFVILFHELAHCWMAIRLGAGAEQILLWPLGGLAYIGHTGSSRDEIKIAGIGPLSNFVLAGLCLGGALLSGVPLQWYYLNPFESWWFLDLGWRNFLIHAIRINMILGLFNLCVPAYPLDGGRVLFAFLTIRHGRQRAAELTTTIAFIVGAALAVWGVAQKEFMLVFIGGWVLFEAYQLRMLAKWGELDSHPAFASAPQFEYMPDRPKKPGFFARWRARRAQKRALRESREAEKVRGQVDAVLEKVSRDGLGSLSSAEKAILERASRQKRGPE